MKISSQIKAYALIDNYNFAKDVTSKSWQNERIEELEKYIRHFGLSNKFDGYIQLLKDSTIKVFNAIYPNVLSSMKQVLFEVIATVGQEKNQEYSIYKGILFKDCIFEENDKNIWILGDTYSYRNILKELGFKYAPKYKKAIPSKSGWYLKKGG